MSEAFRWLLRNTAAAAVALVLAGCSDDQEVKVPCPAAKVLDEPAELTRFREGSGRDPTDILFEARMMRVAGECAYDEDGGEIDVELSVLMDVMRGSALGDGKVSFSYFVAVAEWLPDGGEEPTVLNREAFAVETSIPPERRGLRYQDQLEITIPRPDNRDVRNYVLYLGFELTREELSHNRAKIRY